MPVHGMAFEADPKHPGRFVLVVTATAGTDVLQLHAQKGKHGKELVVTLDQIRAGHVHLQHVFAVKDVDGVVVFGQHRNVTVHQIGLTLPVSFMAATTSHGTPKSKAVEASSLDALDAALAEWASQPRR
jgi:hypothetical protein